MADEEDGIMDTGTLIFLAFILGCTLIALALCCCVYRCTKWCCCPVATSLAPRRLREEDEEDLEMRADRPGRQTRLATSTAANRQYREVTDHVMRQTTSEMFLEKMATGQPIRFTAKQLHGFTAGYSNQLGSGGFGAVYKGALPNGLSVAVKKLHGGLDHKTSKQQFMAEMETIGRTHHVSLVRLYGFCYDGATHALVYEYMRHGSLDDYLSTHGAGLSMAKVAAIGTGVARGLRYLHDECDRKILHLDIKPANVLLDSTLTPKLADFGLARLVDLQDTHVTVSCLCGTPGYAPPEVLLDFDRRITEKCDVYSFGILLLNIVGRGRKLENQQGFPMMAWTSYEAGELMELVGRHGEDACRELVERMCKVAFWCVQRQPSARPSMTSVVKMLEDGKKIDPPPNPFKYLDGPAWAANQRTINSILATRSFQ